MDRFCVQLMAIYNIYNNENLPNRKILLTEWDQKNFQTLKRPGTAQFLKDNKGHCFRPFC